MPPTNTVPCGVFLQLLRRCSSSRSSNSHSLQNASKRTGHHGRRTCGLPWPSRWVAAKNCLCCPPKLDHMAKCGVRVRSAGCLCAATHAHMAPGVVRWSQPQRNERGSGSMHCRLPPAPAHANSRKAPLAANSCKPRCSGGSGRSAGARVLWRVPRPAPPVHTMLCPPCACASCMAAGFG